MEQKANTAIYNAKEANDRYVSLVNDAAAARTKRFNNEHLGNQVLEFNKWLSEKTTWLTSPASSKFHLCVENGLLIHSTVVAENALKIAEAIMPDLPIDSVIMCALWHDLGKVWGGPQLVEKDGKMWVELGTYYEGPLMTKAGPPAATPYKATGNPTGINSATNSLRMVEKFIDLTDGEAQAILGHDGQYIPQNRTHQHKEHPLTLIVHTADMWTGHVIEGGISADWQNEVPFTRLVEDTKKP